MQPLPWVTSGGDTRGGLACGDSPEGVISGQRSFN